jgi:hypothetical protein
MSLDSKEEKIINNQTVFCPRCGSRYSRENAFCNVCGERNIYKNNAVKFQTAKLVIGIISFVIFCVISFQSCAVSLLYAFGGADVFSMSCGYASALCFCVGGILALVARNKAEKSVNYTCAGFYWLVYFFSRFGMKDYPDLEVWGYLAFAFGCIFIFAVSNYKKSKIISILICLIYFILGIV